MKAKKDRKFYYEGDERRITTKHINWKVNVGKVKAGSDRILTNWRITDVD